MKTYGVSRSTTASPERVWSLWSDPNNWSCWNSGIKAAQLDGPLANGTNGKMTTNRDTTHDVTFSNVAQGRGFSMTMSGPPGATFVFSCEITPDGPAARSRRTSPSPDQWLFSLARWAKRWPSTSSPFWTISRVRPKPHRKKSSIYGRAGREARRRRGVLRFPTGRCRRRFRYRAGR